MTYRSFVRRRMLVTLGAGALGMVSSAQAQSSDVLIGEALLGDHVQLPVTIQGHAATVLLDVGSDTGWLFRDALTQLGITSTARWDSLAFGTGVIRNITVGNVGMSAGPGEKPMVGLIGADVLSKYNLLVDGPARRVRIYAPSESTSTWLPPGMTAADCVPMERDSRYPDRIFFPLRLGGREIHSMFDSGSESTNINLAGAHALGINKRTPGIRLLPAGVAGQFMAYSGQKVWMVPSGLPLTIGPHALAESPIYIYQHLPRERGADDAELSMGLSAVRDRVMFVSYSSRRVCLGAPAVSHAPVAKATSKGSSSGAAASETSPIVPLNSDVFTHMTNFWSAFMQLPPAVRDTGRANAQKPLVLHVGLGPLGLLTLPLRSVVDIRAMAAAYPSVATALKSAGLTADQWEEYRQTLFVTALAEQTLDLQETGPSDSILSGTLRDNVAFLRAHADAFTALRATGMWFPTLGQSQDFGGDLDP